MTYQATLSPASHPKPVRPPTVLGFFSIAILGTIGGTLLTTGVFFYTHHAFGWGLKENFRLAMVQGIVYTAGALLAGKLVARIRPRWALGAVHAGMATASAAGAIIVSSPLGRSHALAILGPLLFYTFLSAVAWPILEGLVSAGGLDAHALSRRLTRYNLVWSGTMAAVLALDGMLIQSGPAAVLAAPAAAHALAALWAFGSIFRDDRLGLPSNPDAPDVLAVPSFPTPSSNPPVLPDPEPELLEARTLALWVSRLALPAAYVVIFGLMPMMPSLPVMQALDTRSQTVVSSTWLAARWAAFGALALGTWWHRRPRLMLSASWLMLVAFLAMTIRPSDLWGSARFPPAIDLGFMIFWQALLGGALGVIYSGSLYFGMVLSDGSTEHGGYHEALIGLGWVLGPAAGAAADWAMPGRVGAGVAAVGALIALSVVATSVAGVIHRRKDQD